MKKKEIIIVIILLVFVALLSLYFIILRYDGDKGIIKMSKVEVINQDILLISKSNQRKCIKGLVNYLNKKYYYKCDKIVFYNNTYDTGSNKKYFYALVVGADSSLIEITNLGNGQFKYNYIGNQLTTDSVSSVTGVSYLQIVEPDEYAEQKELDKIREEGKKALPDDTEMP